MSKGEGEDKNTDEEMKKGQGRSEEVEQTNCKATGVTRGDNQEKSNDDEMNSLEGRSGTMEGMGIDSETQEETGKEKRV